MSEASIPGAGDLAADGLSSVEAERRLARDGPNRLPEPPRRGAVARFLAQFGNVLVAVLLAAALLSLWLGHLVDAAVIGAVVLANAAIGFAQEGRAENALAAIRRMIDPRAAVLRDGRRLSAPAGTLVVGDVVLVEAGDRVPADLALLRGRGLRADESALTGESVPVDKAVGPDDPAAPLAARGARLWSGTLIAAGQGAGVVVATGARTELGRIGGLVAGIAPARTPLLVQIDAFGRRLTLVILALAGALFALAVAVRGYGLAEAFMLVVGVAVAAIPEGLPAILTITLAIGVRRMAARNALIRRLPAVETLGAVSVICTDKTGTLTLNEMTAQTIATRGALWRARGEGLSPEGDIVAPDGAGDAARGELVELLRAAALCNDAALRRTAEGWIVEGDPMEGALLALAARGGLDADALRRDLPRRDERPFDSRHRFMATLHGAPSGGARIFFKGAPERILELCAVERRGGSVAPLDPARWRDVAGRLAAEGQRVLAFAMTTREDAPATLGEGDLAGGAIFLGLVGFLDPPRPQAAAALAECRAAGVRVVMITGDHPVTAAAIAREVGLAADPRVVAGPDLERLDETALRALARQTDVFARAAPEHKLRLVAALRDDGAVVAMTGDGVNDAPALERADVGVAMGRKGSEAAKEAAEMVLADDNFASIVAAVREGRTVYDNLLKVIGWILPTNGGEALAIVVALAFGLVLPMTPVQILWVNLVTEVALAVTLALEATEPGAMARPPRRRDAPILSGHLLWRVVFVSLLFMIGQIGLFEWALARGASVETARTLVVNALAAMEIGYLFNIRFAHAPSLTWRGAMGTPAVWLGVGGVAAGQALFTFAPWMQTAFATAPLGPVEIAAAIGAGVAVFAIVEIEKSVRRRLAAVRPAG